MGETAILLRGKRHLVPCGPGKAAALRDCAGALEARLAALEAGARSAGAPAAPGEAQLFLMAALALVEEAGETRRALAGARREAAEARLALAVASAERDSLAARAAAELAKAARRIEALGARLGLRA